MIKGWVAQNAELLADSGNGIVYISLPGPIDKGDIPVAILTPNEVMAEAERCGDCKGVGKVIYTRDSFGNPIWSQDRICPTCNGTGYKPTEAVKWALKHRKEK